METEAPFEMANLFPKHTGLPFVVWISVRGGARHDIRVKVSKGTKVQPGQMVIVGLRPTVHVVEGELDRDELQSLTEWVDANREILLRYWEEEIDTVDAIALLQRL